MEKVVRTSAESIPPELAVRLVRVALVEMCTKQVTTPFTIRTPPPCLR